MGVVPTLIHFVALFRFTIHMGKEGFFALLGGGGKRDTTPFNIDGVPEESCKIDQLKHCGETGFICLLTLGMIVYL